MKRTILFLLTLFACALSYAQEPFQRNDLKTNRLEIYKVEVFDSTGTPVASALLPMTSKQIVRWYAGLNRFKTRWSNGTVTTDSMGSGSGGGGIIAGGDSGKIIFTKVGSLISAQTGVSNESNGLHVGAAEEVYVDLDNDASLPSGRMIIRKDGVTTVFTFDEQGKLTLAGDSSGILFNGEGYEVSGKQKVYSNSGALRLSSRGNTQFVLDNDSTGTTNAIFIYDRDMSHQKFIFEQSGKAGINVNQATLDADTVKLLVGGSTRINGDLFTTGGATVAGTINAGSINLLQPYIAYLISDTATVTIAGVTTSSKINGSWIGNGKNPKGSPIFTPLNGFVGISSTFIGETDSVKVSFSIVK